MSHVGQTRGACFPRCCVSTRSTTDGLFKCNLRHTYEYSALWDYARALYQMPGIAAT